MKIIFPDELVWQSGLEFGLEAVHAVSSSESSPSLVLRSDGEMLEAVTFAALQYALLSRITWVPRPASRYERGDLVVFPRVVAGDPVPVVKARRKGCQIFTSDPSVPGAPPYLLTFPRRDPATLAEILIPHLRAVLRRTDA